MSPRASLRRKIRKIYCEQMRQKARSIIQHCKAWSVDLVVFPEYSLPAELLGDLMAESQDLCIVAGTHAVEPAYLEGGGYGALGISVLPEPGQAVAPILFNGRVLGLQAKLSPAGLEAGLRLGAQWEPVTVPWCEKPLGVMICLDFLQRESAAHRELVGEKLTDCELIAVPSLTPHHTTGEFAAKAIEEAKRYGRPVLYSDWAEGGGSSVYADIRWNSAAQFPLGPGVLKRDEEGVIIADVDVARERVTGSGSSRYATRLPLHPVCACNLVYSVREKDAEYLAWVEGYANQVDGFDLGASRGYVDSAREVLEVFAAAADPARKERLRGLLASLDTLVSKEQIHRHLRDVRLPDEVLPLQNLRCLLADGAVTEVRQWLELECSMETVGRILDRLRVGG